MDSFIKGSTIVFALLMAATFFMVLITTILGNISLAWIQIAGLIMALILVIQIIYKRYIKNEIIEDLNEQILALSFIILLIIFFPSILKVALLYS